MVNLTSEVMFTDKETKELPNITIQYKISYLDKLSVQRKANLISNFLHR